MKKMATAAHQLAADLKLTDDTKHAKDVDLQSVATIKAESLKAGTGTPKKAQSLPPDQEQAMTASYQKDMDAFSKDVDTLGHDIQTDNWAAARTDYAKVMDDEKSGHKAYRVKK
jgi:cytochrome c556